MLIVDIEDWTKKKTTKGPGEKIVQDIKRAIWRHYLSEEKIRIVLDSLRDISALIPDKDGRLQKNIRLPEASRPTRIYMILTGKIVGIE